LVIGFSFDPRSRKGATAPQTKAALIATVSAEKTNQSYLCRILRLTLLAPDIVEATLDGQNQTASNFKNLMNPFPIGW